MNPDNWIFQQQKIKADKKIFVVVPVGIPGMGKSHFIKNVLIPQCEKMNLKVLILSFKEIFKKFYQMKLKESFESS